MRTLFERLDLVKMSNIRPILQIRSCGTTSKASNISNNKNTSEWTKVNSSENFLEIFWKTLSYASAILRPSYKKDISTENVDRPITASSKNSGIVNSETFNKDTSNTSQKNDSEKSYSYLEEAFWEWLGGEKLQDQKKKFLEREKKVDKSVKLTISKSSLQQRTRFLVRSLNTATSPTSQLSRLEEICKHLLVYPLEKSSMVKDGLLRNILWLRKKTTDEGILEQIRVTLALLGYHEPPRGNGIRILSIDGGGTRGLMAIEILRQLEARTNKKVYELFDYMCGASSGAILSFLLGGLRLSPDECEELYYRLSFEVFQPSPLMGTSRLMWNHAYYDTTKWLNTLKDVFHEKLLIDTVRLKHAPKIAAVSAVINLPSLRAFIFRNYNYPSRAHSQYLGSCSYKMWESIRASGAAPGYFQEFCLDEYLHQDGGVLVNNSTALGIHEARLLWPGESIQCVISLGSGRYIPIGNAASPTYTSLKTKILKIIDSATDTEGVHIALHDLLSSNTYFRFNPFLTEFLSLDENRPEKLEQLKNDTQMYLRRNEHKFDQAIQILSKPRSYTHSFNDWISLQRHLWL